MRFSCKGLPLSLLLKKEFLTLFFKPKQSSHPSVCLLVPSSTKGQIISDVKSLPLFSVLLNSIAATTSNTRADFPMKLYLGYDEGDKFYDNKENMKQVEQAVNELKIFTADGFKPQRIAPGTKLTTIWNILFQNGVQDGCEYFFQVGDDCELLTPDWVSKGVNHLQATANFGKSFVNSCVYSLLNAPNEQLDRNCWAL